MIEFVDLYLNDAHRLRVLEEAQLLVGPGALAVIAVAGGQPTGRLMQALIGEVAATSGYVRLWGRDVGRLRKGSLRLLRSQLGLLLRDAPMLPEASIRENIVLPLRIQGMSWRLANDRAAEFIERLDLQDDIGRPVREATPAVRQRAALARALIRGPQIVLAEHPTDRQDADGATRVAATLAHAAAQGAACLVLSSDATLLAYGQRERWQRHTWEGTTLLDVGALGMYDDAHHEVVLLRGGIARGEDTADLVTTGVAFTEPQPSMEFSQ